MTGGRLRRVREHIGDETFCFTYGDGVGDVDIGATLRFHRAHGKLATLTATYPLVRFGALELQGGKVRAFTEKPKGDGGLINGGFFVCEPEVFDLIDDDQTVWEEEPMERLIAANKLRSFRHEGYWQSMDSLRDKQVLEAAWAANPPWKVWS